MNDSGTRCTGEPFQHAEPQRKRPKVCRVLPRVFVSLCPAAARARPERRMPCLVGFPSSPRAPWRLHPAPSFAQMRRTLFS